MDMAGNALYQNGMDGGARRSLLDVAGRIVWSWDARDHAFAHTYDPAGRLTHLYVSTAGAAAVLRERLVYGEGQTAYNVIGRLFRHYDPAGAVITDAYDFKGNLLSSSRWLAADYHAAPNWSALKDLTDPAALDLAAGPQLSTTDRFDSTNWFDALNRVIQSVTPNSTSMSPNVMRPSYNEANLLAQVNVWRQQPGAPTALLDPSTADLQALTVTTYNARGQRASAVDGSQTVTTYEYDPSTFRLVHMTTTRPPTMPAGQQVVQDLAYYYDLVGNITRIRDTADTQNVIFFNNQRVEPSNDYTYDPVYRLTAAAGREHLGQTGGVLSPPSQITDDDSFRAGLLQPGDGQAMGRYQETYAYDAVGNIHLIAHVVSSGSWTRRYAYVQHSQIDSAEGSNQLSATSLPGDPSSGPFTAIYDHDQHGNMIQMPHMPSLAWDEQDRLAATSRQVVNAGIPETTFYTYDSSGQRVVKATDGATTTGSVGPQEHERIYLGAVEIYREFDTSGNLSLQRETLHVEAAVQIVCLCENRTWGTDRGSKALTRYSHGNHLGSAVLELDDNAQIISYEEYFPYGSTSYQAVASQTETPKRYRYTGKERDEESGLSYHAARYYAPWLGRWINPDPLLSLPPSLTNAYGYADCRPTVSRDETGLAPTGPIQHTAQQPLGAPKGPGVPGGPVDLPLSGTGTPPLQDSALVPKTDIAVGPWEYSPALGETSARTARMTKVVTGTKLLRESLIGLGVWAAQEYFDYMVAEIEGYMWTPEPAGTPGPVDGDPLAMPGIGGPAVMDPASTVATSIGLPGGTIIEPRIAPGIGGPAMSAAVRQKDREAIGYGGFHVDPTTMEPKYGYDTPMDTDHLVAEHTIRTHLGKFYPNLTRRQISDIVNMEENLNPMHPSYNRQKQDLTVEEWNDYRIANGLTPLHPDYMSFMKFQQAIVRQLIEKMAEGFMKPK
jgi:RHS repeat-associated protein